MFSVESLQYAGGQCLNFRDVGESYIQSIMLLLIFLKKDDMNIV